eukprot:1979766-Pyramimonas_sp.AAC.1
MRTRPTRPAFRPLTRRPCPMSTLRTWLRSSGKAKQPPPDDPAWSRASLDLAEICAEQNGSSHDA